MKIRQNSFNQEHEWTASSFIKEVPDFELNYDTFSYNISRDTLKDFNKHKEA